MLYVIRNSSLLLKCMLGVNVFVFEYSPAPGVLFEVLNSEHQALEQKAS